MLIAHNQMYSIQIYACQLDALNNSQAVALAAVWLPAAGKQFRVTALKVTAVGTNLRRCLHVAYWQAKAAQGLWQNIDPMRHWGPTRSRTLMIACTMRRPSDAQRDCAHQDRARHLRLEHLSEGRQQVLLQQVVLERLSWHLEHLGETCCLQC